MRVFNAVLFVIFMLFLAGVTVVYLWRTEKKSLLYYIRTMGISAVLGLCIFPFSVSDVLYSERGVESVQNLGGGFPGSESGSAISGRSCWSRCWAAAREPGFF